MDGGVKQDEMTAHIKREVKEKGPRRGERRSTMQSAQPVPPEELVAERIDNNVECNQDGGKSLSGIILPLPEVPPVEIGSLFSA